MYRQYEDPRALEKQLAEAKANLKKAEESLNNMRDCGIANNSGYTQYDALQEELEYWNNEVSELEQRTNFAWQDEEFG